MTPKSQGEIPDIIDNRTEGQKLCDVLNIVLVPGAKALFATAYFNIAGYGLVKDKLKGVSEFSLLLGKEPGSSNELMTPGDVATIMSQNLREETEDLMGEKDTPSLLKDFLEFIKRDSVTVKVLQANFSHGKAYIVQGIPMLGEMAIAGSSNFTAAGLTRNWELNSVHKQTSAVNGIKDWFQWLWGRSDNYKEQLVKLLSDFTADYKPHDIYMKALYEYFKDRFDVDANGDINNPIILADFQHDGYIAAKEILETYNGVLLADSIGLGKTYLALKLLDDYAYKLRQKALVVCPAQLRDLLWNDKLRDCSIRADIISQEMLGRSTFDVAEYQDYDIVVVDESHNFRNSNANRYDNLTLLLTRGKPKNLILMTATPVNNSIFDLYHQIQLIARCKEDYFLGAGIRNLQGYFKMADEKNEELYDLLEEIAVRRSRHYIKKNYPNALIDGKKINWPERELHTVRYSLEKSYVGLYQEIADTIENLNLAGYQLDAYRKNIRRQQLNFFENLKVILEKQGKSKDEIEKFTMKVGRQLAIVHIQKTLFLKRLESSVQAFRISIQRQHDFQERFLELLRRGKVLDTSNYRKIFPDSEDDIGYDEETVEQMINELPQVAPDDYDVEAIERDVEQDKTALEKVLTDIRYSSEENDDKLATLKKELLRLQGKKIIIFSYFRDTIRYIYNNIKDDTNLLQKIENPCINIVDGSVDGKTREDRITCFSPVSNNKPHIKGTDKEIDIIFSTDVLSEGQNLQDGNILINYDLHWNPVRMIQRAGRLDRIGSEWPVIHVYNFFPEDRLEALLNLIHRLYEKLDAIKRSVGLDASTLGEAVDPKDFNALIKINDEDLSILDELEQMSEVAVGEFMKQDLLDFLKGTGEEYLKKIPLGVGSGMEKEKQHGLFVYLKGGDHRFWCYYDLNTGRILDRKLDIARLIKCEPSTARVEPDFDVYEAIGRVKKEVINRFKRAQVSPLTFKSPQNSILNLMQAIKDEGSVLDLIKYYSIPLPRTLLRRLRKIWTDYLQTNNIKALVGNLKAFMFDNPISLQQTASAPDEIKETLDEEDLQLVCWLAINKSEIG